MIIDEKRLAECKPGHREYQQNWACSHNCTMIRRLPDLVQTIETLWKAVKMADRYYASGRKRNRDIELERLLGELLRAKRT